MKGLAIYSCFSAFLCTFAFSQHLVGGHFLKRVEYNLIVACQPLYNMESKRAVEKKVFGDFNAPVEFFYQPSFEGASGFRIIRDSPEASFILEVKHVFNYEMAVNEAYKEAYDERHTIDIPTELMDTLPRNIFNLIFDYNKNIAGKQYLEILPEYFKVENQSFPISDQFAEKLYKMNVSLIDSFKGKGVPPEIADGYTETFRTVVDDEAWSLWIHMPQGNTLKMADLCREIISDAKAEKLDEKKYMTVLDTFED